MNKYVIYANPYEYTVTTLANYKSYIQNARKNIHFPKTDFPDIDSVMEYCEKYLHISRFDFVDLPY